MTTETTTLMQEKQDKPKAVTEIAHSLVGGDRRGDYGHPLDDFCRTAVMWSALLKMRITFVGVAQCMIALKQSREVNKQKQDNMIDACGYAECLDMCYTEQARRLADDWKFDEFTGVWTKPDTTETSVKKLIQDWGKIGGSSDFSKDLYPINPPSPIYPAMPRPYPLIGDPLSGATGTFICSSEVKSNG